ncbi:hypothetical protein PAXRUDRAFT_34206 [Paxillus rubicundulus Ve08.2h10]|uniref:LisH domain-containing protein n=1 Tax=Paxillus rubicundulus Ve08.2h10 TaxID=930991 RepID=A0A0D0E0A9_9AGAM|nr:hypothetical protein PAXRUDRAFT_34206 [Paxillus rubicundulus Ve08.2h10]
MAAGPPGSMSVLPDSTLSSSDPSWEGDRMFNIYIYDYCNKRGFRKTARELLAEAEIPPDSAPPINAKQGLLFEWWSVFWVLFTAKSNGAGTEDAMCYTQHQMQQASMRQGMRPQQPSQMSRMINGQLPDGAGPSSLPGNLGPMQNGAQVPFSMSGAQTNGIPIQSGAPPPASANPAQQQNFNQLMPSQRPGGPQHRGPNGVNPYQSPTMAHSPQHQGGNAGPNQQHPQAPMGQLGPSPHMAHIVQGGMQPPNSNMGQVQPNQTPPFLQLGRSPSRPGTPGRGMMQPSPSLMNRQTPVNVPDGPLNTELGRLPTPQLSTIRQESGLNDKDLHSLTYDEKFRIATLARQRGANQGGRKPGPSGPQGSAGPSNPAQGMQLRPQHMQPQQQQPPQQQQQQQQRVVKRNSTSPGEEHGQLPNSEGSPPDRKRVRRSSVGMDQAPPVAQYQHQQQQQQQQQTQQLMNGGMMRPGPGPMSGRPVNSFQPHGPPGMVNPGMGMQMGGPQMSGNVMSPAMGGPRATSMMGYHQGMRAVTKDLAMANLPGGGGGGTPTPGDPSFNPGQGQPSFPGPQNNRVGQNKPMGMMPPPSPAGGPPKEQSKDVNKVPGPNGTEGSPRNQQPPNPTQSGAQGPPNAGSSTQGSTAPPTPSGTSSSMTAPSPSAVINGTPTINPATQPTTSLPEVPTSFLTTDFMQSVANTLDDFDQSLFRPEDTGINFEQDFREWFNPDDLDMK